MEERKIRPPIKPVVKAQVKKASFTSKVVDNLIGDKPDSILKYVISDIIVPTIKTTVVDVIQNGIEMLLYGSTNKRTNSRPPNSNNQSYVNYNRYSQPTAPQQSINQYGRQKKKNTGDDLMFETRKEAEEVLSHLVDLILDYGRASVADLYDLAGAECGNFTDNNYGWIDLSSATIWGNRNGFRLNLPEVIPIKS